MKIELCVEGNKILINDFTCFHNFSHIIHCRIWLAAKRKKNR